MPLLGDCPIFPEGSVLITPCPAFCGDPPAPALRNAAADGASRIGVPTVGVGVDGMRLWVPKPGSSTLMRDDDGKTPKPPEVELDMATSGLWPLSSGDETGPLTKDEPRRASACAGSCIVRVSQ